MAGPPTTQEPHSLRGPTDRGALLDFQRAFERQEPLATGTLADFLDPDSLRLSLDDGIGEASSARFDVVWTIQGDYAVHYTDDADLNLRWDSHPHAYPGAPSDRHFHPPPDASNAARAVEKSCIEVTEIVLVARAVHSLWRDAYERGSVARVNEAENPP